MELSGKSLAPQYSAILAECEPFLVSYKANWAHVDLAPFGCAIPEERLYDPTTLRSRDVIDDLHRLDSFSFGPQEMLMPRWVLFDCGEFPGIVYGFGKRAYELPQIVRDAYGAGDDPDRFVPLSMWVAIACGEPGAWFGHNLSSANIIARTYPGLATMTKALGVRVTKATRQYGATQWSSSSIGVHMVLGEMELLSAWTPAHTHIETFAYLIEVEPDRLLGCMAPDFQRPESPIDRSLDGDDTAGMQALQADIEQGQRFKLARVERRAHAVQRAHLSKLR